jgi:Dyp-type peroxidase family
MVRLDMQQTPITKPQEQLREVQRALDNLQGNILRGHGRKGSVNLFLRFQDGKQTEVRARIRSLAEREIITSALKQRDQSKMKEQSPNSLFCSFFLSAKGYKYFDPKLLRGFSKEFQGGIKGARERWKDAAEAWEKADEYDFHAMVLLAQADPQMLCQEAQNMRQYFESVIACPYRDIKEERGNAMEVNGRSVEHFGFADDISQPLFFQEDVVKHVHGGGTNTWDPSAGPSLVLIPDPHGRENACGSYLVFLKLEQNPQGFALKIRELAAKMGLAVEQVETFVMGRFRDGTPAALQNTAGRPGDLNNFSFFASDPDGAKCPFSAHIRKANPRDDTASSSERRIARRGITYGYRTIEPKDNPSPKQMPRDEVGLLFMCYQRDIKKQFESLQFLQANNANFVRENTGIDPIIGRMRGGQPQQKWPAAWGAPRTEHQPYSFGSFVTLKGGEYFFAPSMSFLKNL